MNMVIKIFKQQNVNVIFLPRVPSGSWWRDPYQVTQANNRTGGNLVDKTYYTIRNLVTDKEYVIDVMHIRPFYFDPNYVTPLNVAVKDADETVVDTILQYDFQIPWINYGWFAGYVTHHLSPGNVTIIFKTWRHLYRICTDGQLSDSLTFLLHRHSQRTRTHYETNP